MLEFRLKELSDIVDFFVIIESTYTFVGKKKDSYFLNNKLRYNKYLNKIIHIIVDDVPNTKNPWDNEIHQRNCINKGISKLSLKDDDIIIISDCDEIPNTNTLLIVKNEGIDNIYSLEMHFVYYNFNLLSPSYWYNAKILPYKLYKIYKNDLNKLRLLKSIVMKNGGWHLSYFGDVHFIQNKIRNFSHQEFNNETILNTTNLEQKINNGEDIFNRADQKWKKVNLELKHLPNNYKMLLKY